MEKWYQIMKKWKTDSNINILNRNRKYKIYSLMRVGNWIFECDYKWNDNILLIIINIMQL